MKILYIDNKLYQHNSDIHIDFISSLEKSGLCKIVGYGKYLNKIKTNIKPKNSKTVEWELFNILRTHKPDAILTYNPGGKNSKELSWIAEPLSKIDIPKAHITTDYMRSGFDAKEANWFSSVGYDAAIFRTKDSLRHPIDIKNYVLPFSVKAPMYSGFCLKNIKRKKEKVGFIGTSSLAPDIYYQRIAAMNKLRESSLLNETSFNSRQNRAQMIFGTKYVKFLTGNLFNLTCPGNCNYFTAKHFQIPAAYSMLVCADVVGLEDFPKDTYIKYDVNNLDKLISDVIYHIENKNICEEKIDILYKHVIKNHNHRVRGIQLMNIIKDIL